MANCEIAVGMFGLHNVYGGDARGYIEAARLADVAGIDQVVFTDHVVMGEHTERYPYGPFPLPPSAPWFEPLTLLAAIAGSTSRIHLATGVLIAPLRPAALLAKICATLDAIAPGRVELGVGTGWQREEYDALGLDFAQCWTLLDDGVRAMQLLWREAPASFSSRTVNFERVYSTPLPAAAGIPIWYGVKPTPRQAQRIAELGAGWIPISDKAEYVRDGVARIREAFVTAGRDPAQLRVRAHVPTHYDAGGNGDLQRAIDDMGALLEAGATVLEFEHHPYIREPAQLEGFYARLVEARAAC
ncbi:MAG: TIGR03619 family F420-dependent LLM class oxidoreductase [Pseudomonadales bacterium]|nr:TIGR03619 family F420-dependent LLM class oxidoreductase [Pseudomonadales bacterium]